MSSETRVGRQSRSMVSFRSGRLCQNGRGVASDRREALWSEAAWRLLQNSQRGLRVGQGHPAKRERVVAMGQRCARLRTGAAHGQK